MIPPAKSPAERAAEIAAQLAVPRPMRRGSVGERWMKCGQVKCPCHSDPKARHGPYVALTVSEGGKTKSRYLSPQVAAAVGKQIAAMQQFRRQVKELVAVAEQWADTELAQVAAPSDGEKGGSKKPSRRRSPKRSRG